MENHSKYKLYSFALIFIFLVFRLFYLATTHYNLIGDEAYFWDWSRHPDWSYYDQGPMIALIIRFFTTFLPISEFSVRMGAPVFSALTAIVLYFLAREMLKSEKMTFLLLLMFHFAPISTAGGAVITYYAPQIFFMTTSAFCLWRIVRDQKSMWWYFMGISLGLGLLSHHMFVFFSAEVGLFILLSNQNRRWIRKWPPYIALFIELIVASPILIWNIKNNSVMAKHAFGLMDISPDFWRIFLGYIGGQAGIYTPLVFLAVIYGICISGYRGIIKQDNAHLMLFCLSAPLLLFIGMLSIGGRTEANWPASAYITGSISGVLIFSEIYQKGSIIKRRVIKGAYTLSIGFGLIALIVMCYPAVLNTVGLDLPPKLDPANRLYGWKTLGDEVSVLLEQMPEDTFISTIEYGITAQLAFYVKGYPQIYEIPVGRRMSQYDFWIDQIPVKNKDSVFVDKKRIRKKIEKLFKKVELVNHLKIYTDDNKKIRKQFYIYKCYQYLGPEKKLNGY